MLPLHQRRDDLVKKVLEQFHKMTLFPFNLGKIPESNFHANSSCVAEQEVHVSQTTNHIRISALNFNQK
jgi:hypothetical protein